MGLLSSSSSTPMTSSGGLLGRSTAPATPITVPKTSIFPAEPVQPPTQPAVTPEQDATAKHSVLGDIFNAPDNSTLGVIKNTILGIPKAFKTIVPQIGQGIARDVTGIVPSLEGKASVPVPDSPLAKLVYGTQPIPSLYENGKNYMIQNGTDPKVASVEGLPFGMMLAVSDVWAGPEEDAIKLIAHATEENVIEQAIRTHYPVLETEAPALAASLKDVHDPAQVSQTIKDAINHKAVEGANETSSAPSPETDPTVPTYEPTEEESQGHSLEQAAQQHEAPATTEVPPEYARLAQEAQKHPDSQTFLNAIANAPDEHLLRDLYTLKKNPIDGQIKTPEEFYKAVTEGRLETPPDLSGIARESPQTEESQTQRNTTLPRESESSPGETRKPPTEFPSEDPLENASYSASISENNGGVEPPINKGGLRVPEIDFSTGRDKPAIDLSVNTMERNVENVFPKKTAETINDFLVEPVRTNEADRIKYISDLRTQVKKDIVDGMGISPGSKDSKLLQRYGEGRITLAELVKETKNADNIVKANSYMRQVYDDLLDKWNTERAAHGIAPIPKRADYFRHFQDIKSWTSLFGFNTKRPELPTAISGITENFRSRVPWASAALHRLGGAFTEDAIKGLDQYLNTTTRAIFHTDSIQRARLFEKYLRDAADARTRKGLSDLNLSNYASNLNDWANLVSGKQSKLDRAIESVAGRRVLPVLTALTKQFGKNVIGGSISAATTHAIPLVYTLATTDTRGAVAGLIDTLRSPFLDDFTKVGGQQSDFLTRRFGKNEIDKDIWQKGSAILGTPFHVVDQFISRFAVAAKYAEATGKGMSPEEAIKLADNYATRTIGDRSIGNLPNIMNTKTLGMLTEFQVEVNDNLQVLLHDVPRQEQGNALGIARTMVKFTVYSYLFNQVMQNIKGSGKGLDPIDLGLTLAGINQEGSGKDLGTRAELAATDFAKELPFTSLPVGGQIPALQPIAQIATKVTSGDFAGAAEQAGADYASPIGGGLQVQKTVTGITDVNEGSAKNSKGQITAAIAKTPTNYVKGALFGPSAFPEQQAAQAKTTELYDLLDRSKTGAATKKAVATYADLKKVAETQGAVAANAQYEALKKSDPEQATLVAEQVKDEKLGLTQQDMLIKQLPVNDGTRAKYLAQEFNGMTDVTQKKALWEKYVAAGIITKNVEPQLLGLLKK